MNDQNLSGPKYQNVIDTITQMRADAAGLRHVIKHNRRKGQAVYAIRQLEHLAATLTAAAAELEAVTATQDGLRQWKAEALDVLNAWDHAWMAAGTPGELGERKPETTTAAIHRMREEHQLTKIQLAEARAEIARLQAVARG